MPNNPQSTLGMTPIKYYNRARVARVEALEWMQLVNKDGKSSKVRTIPHFHNKELQDYVTINIHDPHSQKTISNIPASLPNNIPSSPSSSSTSPNHPPTASDHHSSPTPISSTDPTQSTFDPIPTSEGSKYAYATRILVALHAPIVNVSFSKHDYIDWSLLHRRMDHIKDEKLANMCKNQLLRDLPKSFPVKLQTHRQDCWICPRACLHNDPHGITINTDHLRP